MDEIEIKQERIIKLLDGKNLDGIILAKNSNISWLTVNLTRFVHFGEIAEELMDKLRAVTKVNASFITNTRPGKKVADIFQKGIRAYGEVGYPGEWKLHHQGGATGYEARGYIATLKINEVVQPNQAFAWNPSIKGTKSEDTIIVNETDCLLYTSDAADE